MANARPCSAAAPCWCAADPGELDLDHVIDLRRLGLGAVTVTADSVHLGPPSRTRTP